MSKRNRRNKQKGGALPLDMLQPQGQPVMVVERTIEKFVEVPEGPEAVMTPFEEYPIPDYKMEYWTKTYDFDTVTGYRNNIYEVYLIRNIRGSKEGDWWMNHMGKEMHWLSIKRLDQRALPDWRHFQQIKSQLVGAENEGFQLHPAESRLHDTANQFHLFVFAEPFPVCVPIGWMQRIVEYDKEANEKLGSKQRPLRG